MTILKAGLVQMGLKAPITESAERIREVMLDAHVRLIVRAGAEGVQVLCLQELFTLPYFAFSRDRKWYAGAERVPDGPTTTLMQELARRHAMVIVAPVFEEHMPGVYYNTAAVIDADGTYLGKYRKNHFGHIEWPWFKRGNLGYPVFRTAYAPIGVYICYDRHFPEGWRLLAMNGAELIVNPSATIESLSRHMWELEQPAAALANGCFVGRSTGSGARARGTPTARPRRGGSTAPAISPIPGARSSPKRARTTTSCWCANWIWTRSAKCATLGNSSRTAVSRLTDRFPTS